jgi:hypothetical protein
MRRSGRSPCHCRLSQADSDARSGKRSVCSEAGKLLREFAGRHAAGVAGQLPKLGATSSRSQEPVVPLAGISTGDGSAPAHRRYRPRRRAARQLGTACLAFSINLTPPPSRVSASLSRNQQVVADAKRLDRVPPHDRARLATPTSIRPSPRHGADRTESERWAAYPGTRTQPSISTRALRLMMALVTVHSPLLLGCLGADAQGARRVPEAHRWCARRRRPRD